MNKKSPCGCSNVPESCGECRFTRFSTEDAELIEMRKRLKRREKWEFNRTISSRRSHAQPGQYHYFDEYMETLMPCDFDAHYKCDNCKMNHIEEDCPKYRPFNTMVPVVKGKQRLGHIDTKKESIDNLKLEIVEANNALALEDEQLGNGYKLCRCCCFSIPPTQFDETVTFHPGYIADIGESHESYRYAVYAYTCCAQSEGASPGCCTHTHVFEH